jgi:hypothetical protein
MFGSGKPHFWVGGFQVLLVNSAFFGWKPHYFDLFVVFVDQQSKVIRNLRIIRQTGLLITS